MGDRCSVDEIVHEIDVLSRYNGGLEATERQWTAEKNQDNVKEQNRYRSLASESVGRLRNEIRKCIKNGWKEGNF